MKLLLAVIRYEVLLQLRSTRFRLAALCYTALCALPSAVLYFGARHQSSEVLGSSAYLNQVLQVQPYLTMLMVGLIAGNRSSAGALREIWAVLAASPMSNAGYILRRTLALLTLILPLSLVPQVLAILAARLAGHEAFDPTTWISTWVLWTVPLAVSLTCYWLAWVTITGGELGALVFTLFGLPMLVSLANQVLLKFHLTLSGYLGLLGWRNLFFWIQRTLQGWGPDSGRWHPGYAATEAPFDLALATGWLLPRWALIAGVAFLGLGLAVAFVRRTRRDLPPRPVPPKHQLRTFLEKLNRWRERYAPDGGLGLRERLAIAAGVVGLGVALTGLLGRQYDFQQLAAKRYRAETEAAFTPLPAGVRLTSWRLHGRLDLDGAVEIEAAGRFENRESSPVAELVFTLNPALDIEALKVPSRHVDIDRDWDRLRLRLDPALAAGEDLEIELRLRGVPATIDLYFGRRLGSFPFVRRYERWIHARFPRDVSDLSRSWTRRAASPRRILLRASDLGPVPRYTPWTLTQRGESRGEGIEPSDYGREVPLESDRIAVDLELDLQTPAEWFLADTCGHASRVEAGRSRLSGTCRTSLTELHVAGGSLVNAETGSSGDTQVVLATLPVHRSLAERKLKSLARVASLSDRAWPGMPGLDGLVALEWPPEFDLDLSRGMTRWARIEPELTGRLLLIPERLLIDEEPFDAEDLVAQLLSRDLLARRELDPDQEHVFRGLFRALMIRRMGLDGDKGATVSGKPWLQQVLQTPILQAKPRQGIIWRRRLPGVLAEIEGRVGGDSLYTGIERFLAASPPEGDELGTIEELLAAVEATSGVSLERTYQDHFLGKAVPVLRLEDVRSWQGGDGWVVEGKMRNTGTGQSICPVVVKTELGERMLTVTVDSASATEFSIRVDRRPHTVLLDPERTCYRFLLKTSATLERANLLG